MFRRHPYYWLWNKSSVDYIKEKFTRFSTTDSTDKGKAKYMFWFIHSVPKPGEPAGDAGAGTFYSAMSNIDLQIDDGNPYAVALRTHYAQHSFIEHVDIHINNGLAGMFDVGNEMEDVKFFGGRLRYLYNKAFAGLAIHDDRYLFRRSAKGGYPHTGSGFNNCTIAGETCSIR